MKRALGNIRLYDRDGECIINLDKFIQMRGIYVRRNSQDNYEHSFDIILEENNKITLTYNNKIAAQEQWANLYERLK